jgi:bacillithiol biosynthesis cysteine-adding enzyme BshC
MDYRLEIKKKDDFSRIFPKGTFLGDYAQNPGRFPQFFHFGPGQENEKITSLQNQPFPHRQALVEYLRDYHLNLGAQPETLRNINGLSDPHALVVMTGQQPDLLTGPLYTIYKTISCLWEAERIKRDFGVPCIPIFWIASEDHDLEEAASIFWPETEGGRDDAGSYSVLSIRPRRGHFKQPAGLFPLDPEGKKFSSFMQKLKMALSRTPTIHSGKVEHIIQSTLQNTLARSGTLGEWFSRVMLTFFSSCGLVLFEPNDAKVKGLARHLWQKVVADPLALPGAVEQAGRELERCGYLRQLSSSTSSSDRCPFFLYEDQPHENQRGEQAPPERVAMDRVTRERVTWDGRLFYTRNRHYSLEQLQELLQRQPERFSPNVYLRPVFSEFLFPTLFYLGGPGEIGYFAQIKGVYEYFGLKMPIILPRFSATVRDVREPASTLLQDDYPQERKLNIFYLLNLYGPDFLKEIQSLKVENYLVHYQIEVNVTLTQ